MRRSTLSLSTSASRIEAIRVSRSCGGEDLEQVLLLLHRDHEVRRDGVGELARVLHAHRGEHGVVVEAVRELDVLLEEADDLRHQAFHPGRRLLGAGHQLDHDLRVALLLAELQGAGAVEALHQHLDVAVGELEALHDAADRAQGVDLLRARVVAGGVVLRGEEDALAAERARARAPGWSSAARSRTGSSCAGRRRRPAAARWGGSRSRRSCHARTCSRSARAGATKEAPARRLQR